MEKLIEVVILFDYYGDLLSKRQYEVINEYYNEDLSLTEIAELNDISKQAVSESIKRGVNRLYSFENKLKLVEKSNRSNKFLLGINNDLKCIVKNLSKEDAENIKYITLRIDKFLDENTGDNYL